MPTFKEFLGIKPKTKKVEKPIQNEQAMERILELDDTKKEFLSQETLERRLAKVRKHIENYQKLLEKMKGTEMRRILDREFELNSAQSPVDSTDPSKRIEYEDWLSALADSKAATQRMKADLQARIDGYQTELSGLEQEEREIEKIIERGH